MATVVLEHTYDEENDLYRIVFGEKVVTTIEQEEMTVCPTCNGSGFQVTGDGGAVEACPTCEGQRVLTNVVEVTEERIEDIEDVVFAGSDERWFRAGGERRSMNTVAEEQREILKNALVQRKRNATRAANLAEEQAASITELPGVGEEL